MREINVGLVGYGFSGAVFHAPIINRVQGLRLSKVVSTNAEKVTQDNPHAAVVDNVNDLFNDPSIDLVVISSPNTTHFPFAFEALQAGKHVVIEKPFVNVVSEGEVLLHLAKEKNLLLSVYHNRRWDGDFLTVQRLIESGDLGEIHTFESHFDRFVPVVSNNWREKDQPGSGTLFDLGSHLIDQALVLFGTPQTIFADIGTQRNSAEADDYFHLLLKYEKTRVILHSSMLMKQQGPRFQVHGTKGSFVKYGYDSQEDLLIKGVKPGDTAWGMEEPEHYGVLTIEDRLSSERIIETETGCYECFYKGIAESIHSGQPAPVRAEEATNTIRIIEAAKQSARLGHQINL